jgi:cobalt-zinc-cadmium efflux system membrane fusion protein
MKFIFKKLLTPMAITTLLFYCNKNETPQTETVETDNSQATTVKLSAKSIQEIGLQTEIITPKQFSKEISVPAKIIVNQDNEAQVGSLIHGRVNKVFAKVGDYVKAGQDLMLVEGLEIGEMKAAFLTAKANLDYYKSNFERQRKLLQENIGSQKALLEAQNEFEKSSAEYASQENRIKAIHLNESELSNQENQSSTGRDFCTLPVKSPINGVIVERNVVIGQSIDETTNAFTVVNLSNVWADGQVYEKDIPIINNTVPVVFKTPASYNESFNGKVIYIGQTIDEKTRTITIRAEFDNSDGKLKPQMFGELIIPVSKTKALVVPAEALQKIENAEYLFVKKDNETFEKVAVVPGQIQNELVEIKSGIKSGDIVVVKGSSYLKAEMMKGSFGEEE